MAAEIPATESWAQRNHFLIRRLHSLSGIVPVGAFVCIHLSVNAAIVAGPSAFQYAVNQIHNLDNLGILKAVEVLFIFIPLVFHALVGILIWLSGRTNVLAYRYGGNIRYTLQRVTGLIATAFILAHLWHMHWLGAPFGGAQFDPHHAAVSAVKAMSPGWTGPVYLVGVLCAVFHLANGIWTFLITWGLTIRPESQRVSGYVCVAIGLVLGVVGLASLVIFKTLDPSTIDSSAIDSSAITQSRHAVVVDVGSVQEA